jgi:hypothetical protein
LLAKRISAFYDSVMSNDFSDTREARLAALSTQEGMARFAAKIRQQTHANTASPEAAHKSLERLGILTPKGRLTKNYRTD